MIDKYLYKNCNRFNNAIVHVKQKLLLLTIMSIFLGLSSCLDDTIVDESYYTFTGNRMGEYLIENPDQFSEFAQMLEKTNVMGLLNAYGYYTCFAPTNEAISKFYEQSGIDSLSQLTDEEILKIVYNHIIPEAVLTTEDFPQGRISQLSMSNRYLSTSFAAKSGMLAIYVNQSSFVSQPNIEVHNGIIHVIDEVIKPTEKTLVEAIEADSNFLLFAEALHLTGLDKKLELVEDRSYDPKNYDYSANGTVTGLGVEIKLPDYRKYGYTALMESDSIFSLYGIYNINDLRNLARQIYDEVYPEDAGISDETDPRNSLYRFIGYHLINKQLGYTKFIIDYVEGIYATNPLYDNYEYIETMCPNTLMEVRTLVTLNKTNLFNYLPSTGEAIEILSSNYDNDAINGVYHEINGILSYNYNVASMISSKRLRMNVASFFPEVANNNMRGRGIENTTRFIIPPGYIEGIEISDDANLQYYSAHNYLGTYQSDEIITTVGAYDITITTLPIPAGTYEVRIGYQPMWNRGAAQLYFDGQPCGIPLDLRVTTDDPSIGYVLPGTDPADPEGFENDKMMRNRGYMKGPSSFRLGTWYSAPSARVSKYYLRKILGIYTFNEPGRHTFRIKASRPGSFEIDLMEFVPTEVLEQEGID